LYVDEIKCIIEISCVILGTFTSWNFQYQEGNYYYLKMLACTGAGPSHKNIFTTKMFFSSIFVGNKNLPAYLPTSQIMCHETTNQQFHMDGLTKLLSEDVSLYWCRS
jgi:hypothetical protein